MTRIAVVVGNPKPASRTLSVATAVADALADALRVGQDRLVVDLAEHAASLFDWAAPELSRITAEVAAADLAVFASPTYKASYTGMLKAVRHRARIRRPARCRSPVGHYRSSAYQGRAADSAAGEVISCHRPR